MTPTVASVGPSAAELLAALHAEAVEDAALPAWSASAFTALLATPGTAALVARDETLPLGLALWRSAGADAEILTLGVVPAARRRGAGGALLAAIAAAAGAAGATRLVLDVARDNAPARALYAAHGFAEAAWRPGYSRPAGTRVDALVLARSLA